MSGGSTFGIQHQLRLLREAISGGGGGGGAQLGFASGDGYISPPAPHDTDPHEVLVLPDILIEGPIEIVATANIEGGAESGIWVRYFEVVVGPDALTEVGWQVTTVPPEAQVPGSTHHLLIVDHFDPANYESFEHGTYDLTLLTAPNNDSDQITVTGPRMWAKAL